MRCKLVSVRSCSPRGKLRRQLVATSCARTARMNVAKLLVTPRSVLAAALSPSSAGDPHALTPTIPPTAITAEQQSARSGRAVTIYRGWGIAATMPSLLVFRPLHCFSAAVLPQLSKWGLRLIFRQMVAMALRESLKLTDECW